MNPAVPERSRKPLLRPAATFATLLVALLALGYAVQQYEGEPEFLRAPVPDFVALFVAPPAADSTQTRRELDELLAIQQRRSAGEVESARADRTKSVWQFAAALGLKPEAMRDLRELSRLADQVEDDVRPYVRAAKYSFLRLRPYEVEPRLQPCVAGVRGDLSYPSGHATYAYVIAYLLSDMVPERRAQLTARAQEFGRQRMVCGVHFPSDLTAGRRGAEWLAQRFLESADYLATAERARDELRNALGLATTRVTPAGLN